jgi:hypothetical protein
VFRRIFIVGVCLALVLPPVAGWAQEAGRLAGAKFIAEATSPISGGNVAAARQAALSEALRGAVEAAALSLTGEPQGEPGRLRPWLSRPDNYILSYRVLSEGELSAAQRPGEPPRLPAEGGLAGAPQDLEPEEAEARPGYSVRVEALVSLAALKRDLRAQGLLGAEETLPPVVASIEEVAGETDAGTAEAILLAALRRGGFKVRTASGWFRQLAPGELVVAARLRLACGAGGCSGEAELASKDEWEEPKAQAYGTAKGGTGEEALSGALRAAVASLAKQLVALQQQVVVLLNLRGLAGYGELAQVKAALEEMGLEGRERSLSPEEIVLEVGLVGGGEALARRLASRDFDGFGLVTADSAQGSLTLDAVHPARVPALAP